METVWLAFIGGLILGWLIEWVIDWQFWRKNVESLRQENQRLRTQLEAAQRQLAALQTSASPPSSAPAATPTQEPTQEPTSREPVEKPAPAPGADVAPPDQQPVPTGE